MRARSLGLLVVAATAWSGCAAYSPLVCDPARAGELAFGFQSAGANFPFPGSVANGDRFLFVDGACRYWARGSTPAHVVTGVLDEALLAEMNAGLLTGAWPAVDGEHVTGCCDGATFSLARDDIRASAYQLATRSEALALLISTSMRWEERLGGVGTPLSEGPVRLELMALPTFRPPFSPPPVEIPWPLTTPLDTVLGGELPRVFEGSDAASLRATERTGVFVQGTTSASFHVVDVVPPFADESGCVRLVSTGYCR